MQNIEEDKKLVKDFLAGNESAFNKLVSKYQQKIYWHARRMTNNHIDADEVTQEVLIVMYKKLRNFNFDSSLYTWIYKITSTRSLNLLKKKKIKNLFSIEDSEVLRISNQQDIVHDYDDKEKLEKLEDILGKLPVKQREVFSLRHFDELTYEEISEITGKSVGGLKANYFHALKKVTELMKDE
jgi:RNA polymerase sigma-70 factor (ECF subfamily)